MVDTHDYNTKEVIGRDLNDTHVLVGESGGLSAIYEIGTEKVMGAIVVYTEHGSLYVDDDDTYLVIVEDPPA